MVTILEYLWWRDHQTILRLMGIRLLSAAIVKSLIGIRVHKVELPSDYDRLMRHDAYKRGRGGAIRQVRWA